MRCTIDEVVKVFIKNEDHNFSLFNYVTEQNNEIEKIEEQIQQLRDEEVKFAQESGQDANQHKEVLKDLEEKLHTSELMAEKYDKHNQELQRIIESLKRGMQSIFIKFDFTAEETGIIDPTVTESNMVNYLAHIERKAANLLQQYSSLRQALFDQSTKAQEVDQEAQKKNLSQTLVTVLGTGPKIPMGETGFSSINVNPPKSDDFYQSDEDDDDANYFQNDQDDLRPLTRDELKARTIAKLQKKYNLSGMNSGTKEEKKTKRNSQR